MDELKACLQQKLGPLYVKLSEDNINALHQAGYDEEKLGLASRESLLALSLPFAVVDLLRAKCGRSSCGPQGVHEDAAAAQAAPAAGTMPPDYTNEYLRAMLQPSAISLTAQPAQVDLQSFLEGPLGRKLPAWLAYVTTAASDTSDILTYVIGDKEFPGPVHSLSLAVTSVLSRNGPLVISECATAFKVRTLVDVPLLLASSALNLDIKIDRNVQHTSCATVQKLRPDFVCWVKNVLLFKGEERAPGNLEVAIEELSSKMSDTWKPELLPGISMPCMLAYAAAGNVMQFFAIVGCGTRPATIAISSRYDLDTALGRIRAFHGTCNIVRLLASYASRAPQLSVALGRVMEARDGRGEPLRTITFFQDFVQKRVFSFEEQHGVVMNFSTLRELYSDPKLMECANLVHLHAPGAIRLDDTTLVLHLVPVGVPQHGPPGDEAGLKKAIRDTITGVAALHAAGFVHRDIRWPNVVEVPGSQPGMAGMFVLIDLEHAARKDCPVDCRQPPYELASWPQYDILDPADGRYTPASDLCLVSHCLMSGLSFKLSLSGQGLQHALAARQLSAEGALAHEWFSS